MGAPVDTRSALTADAGTTNGAVEEAEKQRDRGRVGTRRDKKRCILYEVRLHDAPYAVKRNQIEEPNW